MKSFPVLLVNILVTRHLLVLAVLLALRLLMGPLLALVTTVMYWYLALVVIVSYVPMLLPTAALSVLQLSRPTTSFSPTRHWLML